MAKTVRTHGKWPFLHIHFFWNKEGWGVRELEDFAKSIWNFEFHIANYFCNITQEIRQILRILEGKAIWGTTMQMTKTRKKRTKRHYLNSLHRLDAICSLLPQFFAFPGPRWVFDFSEDQEQPAPQLHFYAMRLKNRLRKKIIKMEDLV